MAISTRAVQGVGMVMASSNRAVQGLGMGMVMASRNRAVQEVGVEMQVGQMEVHETCAGVY